MNLRLRNAKKIMEIDLRFLRYSEKIVRAYSAIAQNSTQWKSTFIGGFNHFYFVLFGSMSHIFNGNPHRTNEHITHHCTTT